jgi:hypothetical protein
LCQEGCKPQRGERRHNDANEKKRDFFARYDLAKLAEIEAREIPYWTPPHRMMNVESDTERWGDEWRPGRNFRTVTELFTKRVICGRWRCYQKHSAKQSEAYLRFALTGILFNCPKCIGIAQSLKGGFQMGTFIFPRKCKLSMFGVLLRIKVSNDI